MVDDNLVSDNEWDFKMWIRWNRDSGVSTLSLSVGHSWGFQKQHHLGSMGTDPPEKFWINILQNGICGHFSYKDMVYVTALFISVYAVVVGTVH